MARTFGGVNHKLNGRLRGIPSMSDLPVRGLANAIRALSMDAVEAAKSGHPGMPMGMADAATVLWAKHLKFDPADPHWPDRDRFILSAGHGSMLLYSLLHLTGFADMTMDEIKRFRQLGSRTPGHPEYGHADGVETTTGPLGQGLANAVGFALAERRLNAQFGDELVDHRTWVIAGDGCLMEGVSQEAIALAGRLQLHKLIVLWDDNNISIDGKVSLADRTDQRQRFEASGWATMAADGHDPKALDAAFAMAKTSDKPVLIAVKTTIGFGAPTRAGTAKAHGEALGATEIEGARKALDWPYAPFEIPDDVLSAWRAVGARGEKERLAWGKRHAKAMSAAAFDFAMSGELPKAGLDALSAHTAKMAAERPQLATRASSGLALDAVFPHAPTLLGGSADLTGSNNTLVKGTPIVDIGAYGGGYVHYGVREHGMAAAMNGLALHGGVIPYAGTFLSFADYARPAIRLAALMGIRVIHVMTHDSIGLGEDGPTHQPVEHLASLRAMPNLLTFRPCDAVETAECWALALAAATQPSVLALSRQAVPGLRGEAGANRAAAGAYELAAAEGGPAQVSLFATGTEVSVAMAARAQLHAAGVPTRVVSAPCFALFERLSLAAQAAVIGDAPVRIAVEAGVRQGWELFLRPQDTFIGLSGFGASAPAKDLYAHFGITAEAVTAAAKAALG
jgi:transketolase